MKTGGKHRCSQEPGQDLSCQQREASQQSKGQERPRSAPKWAGQSDPRSREAPPTPGPAQQGVNCTDGKSKEALSHLEAPNSEWRLGCREAPCSLRAQRLTPGAWEPRGGRRDPLPEGSLAFLRGW